MIKGYLYMIFSALFFCLMTVFVKLSGQEIHTIQIVLIRGLITLFFTYLMLLYYGVYPLGNNKRILMLRGFVGTIALFLVFESIQRFSLPEATVIQYLYPIFTAILAFLLLSEKIGKILFLAIILGIIGVYTILDFPFQNSNSMIIKEDIFIAISGSFFTGLAYVLVRKSSNLNESPYVIMFYFPLFTVPISLLFMPAYWIQPSLNTWLYLLLVGIFSQLGQFCLTFGYKLLPATRAAITSYLQVPFSVLAGIIIFHDNISYNFIIGSIIVFSTMILVIQNGSTEGQYNDSGKNII